MERYCWDEKNQIANSFSIGLKFGDPACLRNDLEFVLPDIFNV